MKTLKKIIHYVLLQVQNQNGKMSDDTDWSVCVEARNREGKWRWPMCQSSSAIYESGIQYELSVVWALLWANEREGASERDIERAT